ncbi:MAG: RodZ domain-containing protein [Panacagrimonas sp.]
MAIRTARQKARLSVDELASRTRLARTAIEALENDAFDQLIEPVYVRGYYRKCAKVLGLAEEPLIAAYQAAYTPKPTISPARLRLASGGDLGTLKGGSSRRLVILAPLAAIVISAAIWFGRQNLETAPGTGADPAVVGGAATPASPVVSDTMPPLEPPIDPAAPSAPVDAGAAPVVDPAPPAPDGATQELAVAPAASATQLVLMFSAISWARVEDASGKALLSGVIGAGEQRVLDGRPPYSVFLGNAPGVKVQFGGQPVDLKAVMKGNSTARFSVPVAAR